jgi:Cd2+/Zn2+-exporting ATPase
MQNSCAVAKPLNVTATEVTGESCCSSQSDSCLSEDTEDPLEGSGAQEQSIVKTWKVAGMDCPSCARKVEKATGSLPGVSSTKVLFATEKLVVRVDAHQYLSDVESAVKSAGFKLISADETSANPNSSSLQSWIDFLKENFHIIAISLGMTLAALMQASQPVLSDRIFALTCLLGLMPITSKAWRLARSGTPFSIETLMSVAALGALYLGEYVEAAMVLLLFLIGERLEAFAASKARSGVTALMSLVPEQATLVVEGKRNVVSASQLSPGDIIEVAPGDRLPADGVLVSSSASFDESALTGESLPVEREVGDKVMAGAVLADKVVTLRVTSKQGENAIDRILHLIEEAESRKAPIERFLDKFSRWYTPLMMLVSLLVIITPPLLFEQSWDTWIYRGLALLLIACPCALVISTPAAITSGLAAAAKRGALIKGGAALEQLGNVEVVAFDKTGTLTLGRPAVTDVIAFAPFSELELLEVSAAIEMGSNHPLARSLVQYVEDKDITIPHADEKRALVGAGVEGRMGDRHFALKSPSKLDFDVGFEIEQQIAKLESAGKTAVVLIEGQSIVGLIAWQDEVRGEAAEAVSALSRLGIHSVMLTGDNERSAKAIAAPLGMGYEASLLPAGKVAYVEKISHSQRVAMVGDGINDAPAMKAANIGVAMGGGTDVALETADAALTHNRLVELPTMVELSRATLNNIKQNVTLALGLKGVFLVTSLFGITGLWVAVLADSGATALVTLNALRLLRYKTKS